MRFHFSRHKVLRIHFVNNLYSYSNTQARLYLSTWRFGVMSAKSKNTALRNDFLEFFVARPFRDLIRLELYKATILLWPTSSLGANANRDSNLEESLSRIENHFVRSKPIFAPCFIPIIFRRERFSRE